MKLCGCVSGKNVRECMAIASRYEVDMIEHRLDALTNTVDLEVFYKMIDAPIIATNRPKAGVSESKRVSLLKEAIDAGASYIDVEHDAEGRTELFSYAKEKGARIILSYHDHERSGSLESLKKQYCAMEDGADIIKIVTTAKTVDEAHRLLDLMVFAQGKTPLIAFAMGKTGAFTRPLSLIYGAPFTYVALGHPTAPGQFSVDDMREALRVLT